MKFSENQTRIFSIIRLIGILTLLLNVLFNNNDNIVNIIGFSLLFIGFLFIWINSDEKEKAKSKKIFALIGAGAIGVLIYLLMKF